MRDHFRQAGGDPSQFVMLMPRRGDLVTCFSYSEECWRDNVPPGRCNPGGAEVCSALFFSPSLTPCPPRKVIVFFLLVFLLQTILMSTM